MYMDNHVDYILRSVNKLTFNNINNMLKYIYIYYCY